MNISWTLYRYLSLQFLISVGTILGILLAFVYLLDIVEMLRQFSGRAEVSFSRIALLGLLKLPYVAEQMLPFAFLFGAMLAFTKLTRNHELVVVRASGVSVWQFLLPGLVVALVTGIFTITVYNTVSATFYQEFENLHANSLQSKSRLLQVSRQGLWLRQGDRNEQSVIHALGIKDRGRTLEHVIIFLYEGGDNWVGRIDAQSAILEPGYWDIKNAQITEAGLPTVFRQNYRLETSLTVDQIQDSFASPDTMSFWDLPHFIEVAEAAGFSALRHRLHWHTVLSTPFLLCAMVLIAATVSLRLTRLGGISRLVVAGVITGFILYFISDLASALGMSGNLPVTLAAWSPTFVALLLGLATLFYLEDG